MRLSLAAQMKLFVVDEEFDYSLLTNWKMNRDGRFVGAGH